MSYRLLLIDSFSKNTGDIAILVAMLRELTKKDSYEITVEASHPSVVRGSVNKVSNKIQIVQRYNYSAYVSVDSVISVGGGFISTNFAWYMRCLNFLVCNILHKPYLVLGQSIGPFDSQVSKKITYFFLGRAKKITIREPESLRFLPSNIQKKVEVTADFAFLIEPLSLRKSRMVSLCIIKPSATKSLYLQHITSFCEFLLKEGFKITLISHTPNDDDTLTEIAGRIQSREVTIVKFTPDVDIIRSFYSQSTFSVCNRMHASIFSMIENTPFILLSYEPKFKGLVDLIGYPEELLIDDGHCTFETLEKTYAYLQSNYSKISKQLETRVPELRKNAEKNLIDL